MAVILFEDEYMVANRIPPRKGGMLAARPRKLVRIEKGILREEPDKFRPSIVGAKTEGVSLFDRLKTLILPNSFRNSERMKSSKDS